MKCLCKTNIEDQLGFRRNPMLLLREPKHNQVQAIYCISYKNILFRDNNIGQNDYFEGKWLLKSKSLRAI